MKTRNAPIAALSALLLLNGCAATPMGPTVQVMPGSNKPFQVFQQDVESCKQFATSQVSGQADSANERAILGTLLGAGLGAGLGAAVGGNHGAGVGAAAGGALGAGMGAGSSERAQIPIQTQYNNSYTQCMYAKGNQVPGAVVGVTYMPPPPVVVVTPGYAAPPAASYPPPNTAPPATYAPPPTANTYAPPPANYPPPPPPPAP